MFGNSIHIFNVKLIDLSGNAVTYSWFGNRGVRISEAPLYCNMSENYLFIDSMFIGNI